jgi:hypothetical protein
VVRRLPEWHKTFDKFASMLWRRLVSKPFVTRCVHNCFQFEKECKRIFYFFKFHKNSLKLNQIFFRFQILFLLAFVQQLTLIILLFYWDPLKPNTFKNYYIDYIFFLCYAICENFWLVHNISEFFVFKFKFSHSRFFPRGELISSFKNEMI